MPHGVKQSTLKWIYNINSLIQRVPRNVFYYWKERYVFRVNVNAYRKSICTEMLPNIATNVWSRNLCKWSNARSFNSTCPTHLIKDFVKHGVYRIPTAKISFSYRFYFVIGSFSLIFWTFSKIYEFVQCFIRSILA